VTAAIIAPAKILFAPTHGCRGRTFTEEHTMPVSLVNNLNSLSSQSKLNATGSKLGQTIQRLSTGLRINNSGDDAAGLAIANSFRSDISVLRQGVRNANDGLSTLQIVDGGLNTISGLLDRAATLAAQSASDTFTGDRNTLQSEFGKVLGEITRQAENIGLVSGGGNNKSLTTVIGGGSDTFAAAGSNNGVVIDLSGAGNRVDATSLGLSGVNIGQAQGSVDGTAITALGADEVLTFRVADAAGALTTFSVSLANGDTATEVVGKINDSASAAAAGIKAELKSDGTLSLSSSSFFTVESDVAAAAGTTTGIGNAGEKVSSAANNVSLTAAATTTAGTQSLVFTVGSKGDMIRVDVTAGNEAANVNAADTIAAINANTSLRDAGIYAISSDNAAGIQIVSTKNSFQLNVEAPTVSTAQVFAGAVGSRTVTAGAAGGGADGAKAALDAIRTAVKTLGEVQGRVGAGQNTLAQAIELATSQVTNLQAAESRIRDADTAAEASDLARLNVLQQAGVAALAQANQASQAVLSLLRG
jgi:flagellin